MRALVEGLETPHPIGLQLPALFQDDDFAQGFTQGLDQVLAPIYLTLDSLEAYVDADLAPSDFLQWLAGWVGADIDAGWPEERRREFVRRAPELYAWAGTARGVADAVEIATEHRPVIEESGGTSWSSAPGSDAPGSAAATMTVRLEVDDEKAIDQERLKRLVDRFVPAHVVVTLDIRRKAAERRKKTDESSDGESS